MTPAEILDKAADVIVERGWHQGGYMSLGANPNTCQVCVLGAMNVAVGNNPDDADVNIAEAAEAFAGYLGLVIRRDEFDDDDDPDTDPIAEAVGNNWNDFVATSAEQVVAALRACAANLRTEVTA